MFLKFLLTKIWNKTKVLTVCYFLYVICNLSRGAIALLPCKEPVRPSVVFQQFFGVVMVLYSTTAKEPVKPLYSI